MVSLFLRSRFIAFGTLALSAVLAPLARAQTLVGYYSFDTGTLSTIGSSVLAATGTGSPLSLLSTAPQFDASGRFGGAVNFSGGSPLDGVFGTGSTTIGNNFSISVWLKTSDVTAISNSYLFQTGVSGAGAQNAILFGYNNATAELYGSSQGLSGSTDPRAISGMTLSSSLNNTWVNLVYTYNGSTLRGYLNGSEAFSTPATFSLIAGGGLSIGGARDGNGLFSGSLDDFAIWNGALTQTQITALQTSSALSVSAIPEPSTYAALCGVAMLGFAAWHRKSSKRSS
jgi:hypothetical protein